MPIGVDVIEMPMLRELEAAGITGNDGQQVMLNARQIKNKDEILLLSQAASMVDGVYQDISKHSSSVFARTTSSPSLPAACRDGLGA